VAQELVLAILRGIDEFCGQWSDAIINGDRNIGGICCLYGDGELFPRLDLGPRSLYALSQRAATAGHVNRSLCTLKCRRANIKN
jgi:hypothetical protein